jgi:hypothetical protein
MGFAGDYGNDWAAGIQVAADAALHQWFKDVH